MGEVLFYHLTAQPLERALPVMLDRLLSRGGRAVVRGTDPGRIEHLDTHLWTYAKDSFLPHARDGADGAASQPVWLTTAPDIPNGATTLFLIDGAEASGSELETLERTAILFDGHTPEAVEAARAQWRSVTAAGLAAVYWAQSPEGRWERKAENKPE